MKKVLLVDGQVFQSGAWHRGMGKYSFELLRNTINKISGYEKIVLLLNSSLAIEHDAEEQLEKLFGKNNVVRVNLVQASREALKDINANKKTINNYVNNNYANHDVSYLILSLFLDNGCAVFPDNSNKFLLFYDSIPFIFPDKYINRINYDNYLTLHRTVFEADIIFAISQTVADDTVLNFGIDKNKVINIDGARIGDKAKHATKPELVDEDTKIILCPTGDELRKNNLRAVQGFEIFNQKHNNAYKLVLTSFFGEYTKQQLTTISDNIIFTGNIPKDELEWLYGNCELVLFPSEYEGLGLPILEAITYDKKIVCSDIPVFNEISNSAFYSFDPFSPIDLAHKLDDALLDQKAIRIHNYKQIKNKYTWERTGAVAANVIKEYRKKDAVDKKIKLAILAPSPDGYSAIGKVVAESHASLSEYFDITYYFEKGPEHRYLRPDYLSKVAKNYPVSKFNLDEYCKYDAVLYHIGNSEYHMSTIANALVYPGHAIFHDTNLGGAYGLLRNMGLMTSKRYATEEAMDVVNKNKKGHFLSSVALSQIGIYVHSKYALSAIKEINKDIAVQQLNLPVDTPVLSRKKLANASRKTVISLAGIIAGIKGLQLIERLSAIDNDNIEIKVFGYLQSNELKQQINDMPNVTLVTNPTDHEFQEMLSKTDILLNYRMKYQGETSLTVLEAMRHGCAVIVRDIGWYSELPNEAVVKAKTEVEAIDKVVQLANNRKLLSKTSTNAKEYIAKDHSHSIYAKELYDAIKTTKNTGKEKKYRFIKDTKPSTKQLLKYLETI
jgi:glycosyltransferase involved in cell wall biosynthesis